MKIHQIINHLKRKKTLLVLSALQHAEDQQREQILSIISGHPNDEDVQQIQKIFQDIGVFQMVVRLAEEKIGKAKEQIPLITDSAEILENFADYMIKRKK